MQPIHLYLIEASPLSLLYYKHLKIFFPKIARLLILVIKMLYNNKSISKCVFKIRPATNQIRVIRIYYLIISSMPLTTDGVLEA